MAELNLASMTDESLRALHGEPVSELRRAPSPAQWWLARYQAISLLKRDSPRLFEALTAQARLPMDGAHRAPQALDARARGTQAEGPRLRWSPALFRTRGDPSRSKRTLGAYGLAHESGGHGLGVRLRGAPARLTAAKPLLGEECGC